MQPVLLFLFVLLSPAGPPLAAEEQYVQPPASVVSEFGRLRFSNSGYDHSYYVYANGTFLGADIGEIDLPVGTYEIEIRRRDDGFSHVVGQRTVTLKPDDYVEILFSMDQAAPPVPGYMRLTNPSERWRGIFTLRGAGLIPMGGFESVTTKEAWAAAATALFGHVPFRHFVTGVEVEQLKFRATEEPGVDMDVQGTSVMGVLGLTAGPVSGVDFIARGGAGVSIYSVDRTDVRENRYDPAFNGAVEFGFGIGKHSRVSLQTGLFGIVRDGRFYSWLQLGVGLGELDVSLTRSE